MARPVNLLSFKNQALQRASFENASLVFNVEELTAMVNNSIAYLYETIVSTDEQYRLKSQPYTTLVSNVANNPDLYALPADFYELRGVDININGVVVDARRFMFSERVLYQSPSVWTEGSPIAYDIWDSNLKLFPVPTGQYAITLWYTPAPGQLYDDYDTFDCVAGWEEFITLDVASKMLQKSGEAHPVILQARAEQLERVKAMARHRDAGQGARVNRTRYYRESSMRWRPRWT